jgi:coenzyme F420-reducing hydrogenase delta subunit/Pyruvate/2-oxoacid:ferredoxin oxidoreductase delta subunit
MIPQEEFRKIPRVLIWGSGLSAEETASHLISLGYEVSSVPSNEQTQLLRIEGFAGDFLVHFRSDQKEWAEAAGAVVFAPELISEAGLKDVPLTASGQVMGLKDTFILFSSSGQSHTKGEGRPANFTPASYVAFLTGFNDEGNVVDMAQTLSLALKIRQGYQAQVFIFCPDVKVAEEGMERLYQACRDEGVLFFKLDHKGPEIIRSNDLLSLEFIDAVLGQPFQLTPDLLVIDSPQALPIEIQEAALSARIGMDESGFLQPANVHLLPQATEREGIFIAGSGKGPMLSRSCVEEARAAALSVHHFFEGRISDRMDREVTVDKGLCTLCLTCIRYCPHQAIGFTHRVFIHPFACQRCGICASECPMDAIQITGFSDQEVELKLAALPERWGQGESGRPKLIIFGCQRSAGVAWEEAQSAGYKVQGEVEFIALPCAGKLDPDYVLKALVLGAHGVLVLACPEENCQSLYGNTYARNRIMEAKKYIEEAGLNPDRIRFKNLSSNMVWYLKEVIGEFMDELNGSKNPQSKI